MMSAAMDLPVKMISEQDVSAMRAVMRVVDINKLHDCDLDLMVALIDGTTDPDQWIADDRVPYPGYVIAPVADVVTPDQRAAVGRWLDFWTTQSDYMDSEQYVDAQIVADILRAIAEGGTK